MRILLATVRNSMVVIILVGIAVGAIFASEWIRVTGPTVRGWVNDQSGDCAVVLTGGPGRVREGLDLLAQGSVKKLIVSGVNPQAKLREIFPMWPYYGELSEDDVVLERRSRTTYGNAQQTLPLVEAFQCQSVLLVTSRIHMYRALKTFQSIYPADVRLVPHATYAPHTSSYWQDVGLETVKSLFYAVWAY